VPYDRSDSGKCRYRGGKRGRAKSFSGAEKERKVEPQAPAEQAPAQTTPSRTFNRQREGKKTATSKTRGAAWRHIPLHLSCKKADKPARPYPLRKKSPPHLPPNLSSPSGKKRNDAARRLAETEKSRAGRRQPLLEIVGLFESNHTETEKKDSMERTYSRQHRSHR